MPGSSWTVVRFNDENSVEAVPTSWIFDKRCYWPPFQHDKLMTCIRKNEEPNTHWPSYEVTIFRNSTYDNYMIARAKSRKAESTSDLNSEVSIADAGEKKKRKIRKKQFSSSEEDESTHRCLQTPPLLEDNYGAQEDTIDKDIAQTYDAKNRTTKIISISQQHSQSLQSVRKPWRMEEMQSAGEQVAAQDGTCNNDCIHSNENNNSLLLNSVECTCQLCPAHSQMQNTNEKYLKEIIRQQNYFKAQLWQTCEDIRDIKNAGVNVIATDTIAQQESVFRSFTLPIETEQQLGDVEEFLKNQTNFNTSVTEASRVGGKHSYEFMKRNLTQILSDKLAQKYSWLGKKEKTKFSKLKISEMLIAAGEAYNNAFTKKELEESITKWLRRAKERSDAYEKRHTREECIG